MKLKPFWAYFGGKWRAAKHYPAPKHDLIVEPFAGAAGYALNYSDRDVLLIDAYDAVADLWNYLIHADEDEILSLPDLEPGQTVDDLDVPEGAKHLIGFRLNMGTTRPCKSPSSWMRGGTHPQQFWGENMRRRIAAQLKHIRHWQVLCGPYHAAPDVEATWFVDPPYQQRGKDYVCSSRDLNFFHLGRWCRERAGQVIVCENEGANWLPFERFREERGTPGRHRPGTSVEVIWTQDRPLAVPERRAA